MTFGRFAKVLTSCARYVVNGFYNFDNRFRLTHYNIFNTEYVNYLLNFRVYLIIVKKKREQTKYCNQGLYLRIVYGKSWPWKYYQSSWYKNGNYLFHLEKWLFTKSHLSNVFFFLQNLWLFSLRKTCFRDFLRETKDLVKLFVN